MQQALTLMTAAIAGILQENEPSIYLYGSCTMNDFRPGWSDIDLLVVTKSPITAPQAEALLPLRHILPLSYPSVPHFRAFEGCMLCADIISNSTPGTVVYWGTSGQRITDRFTLDAFCLWELHHGGQLLEGPERREILPHPTPSNLHQGVARHLHTILDHGRGGQTLYTFGWLLDTARGLYTLRHDAVISKTAAGEWALAEGFCPDAEALRLALAVRREPALIRQEAVLRQAELLTPAIQRFAAVLQRELEARRIPIPD